MRVRQSDLLRYAVGCRQSVQWLPGWFRPRSAGWPADTGDARHGWVTATTAHAIPLHFYVCNAKKKLQILGSVFIITFKNRRLLVYFPCCSCILAVYTVCCFENLKKSSNVQTLNTNISDVVCVCVCLCIQVMFRSVWWIRKASWRWRWSGHEALPPNQAPNPSQVIHTHMRTVKP